METQNRFSSPNNGEEQLDDMDSSYLTSRSPNLLGRKPADDSVDVDSQTSSDESDSDDGVGDLGDIDEIQELVMKLKKERELLLVIRSDLDNDRQSWQSGHETMSSTPLQNAAVKDRHLFPDEKSTTNDSNTEERRGFDNPPQHGDVNGHVWRPIADSPPAVAQRNLQQGVSLGQHRQQSSSYQRDQRTLPMSSIPTGPVDTAPSFSNHLRASSEFNPQHHIPLHRLTPTLQNTANVGQTSPRQIEGQSRYSPRQVYQTSPQPAVQHQDVRVYERSPFSHAVSNDPSWTSGGALPRMAVQDPVLSLEERMQLMMGRSDIAPGPSLSNGQTFAVHGDGYRSILPEQHSFGAGAQQDASNRFNQHNPYAMVSPRMAGWSDAQHVQNQHAYQRPMGDAMMRSMGLSGGLSPRGSSSVSHSSYEWEIDPKKLTFFDRVGSGSFGEVTRASWMGIQVAVKRIRVRDPVDPAIVRDFQSELDILSKVRHTNCILFMGACSCPPELMIVTEYAKRGSLFELLHNKQELLDWRLRLRIAFEAATGVLYLHTRQIPIVHRDLKSENILLTENYTVKICDFGMARLKLHSTHIETQHANAGTPAWMAPEVLRGEHFDEKADVYSFSIILWEILYRKEPWADKKPLQILSLVGLMGQRLDLTQYDPQCPPAFVSLIRECWNHQPQARPDFAQIVHRLQNMQLGSTGHLSPRQCCTR